MDTRTNTIILSIRNGRRARARANRPQAFLAESAIAKFRRGGAAAYTDQDMDQAWRASGKNCIRIDRIEFIGPKTKIASKLKPQTI